MDNRGYLDEQSYQALYAVHPRTLARPTVDTGAVAMPHGMAEEVLGTLLGHFTPDECRNYLVNSGYAST